MIHPTAIVDSKAELASDVEVGPYSIIGPEVKIGAGTRLESHVVIQGKTSIGVGNKIFPFTVIGTPTQDLKAKGEPGSIEIGSNNVIREHVSIHLANAVGEKTQIGSNNLLMGEVHVGHNCRVGDHVVLSQGVGLSGHVEVGDYAVLGGQAGVHQFVRIGRFAMVGGKAAAFQDIPPYETVLGIPARFVGVNRVGLERSGISSEVINHITRCFELIYSSNGSTLDKIIPKLEEEIPQGKEVLHLLQFLQESKRGICGR